MYTAHRQKEWFGRFVHNFKTSDASITFNWLWADTEYQICGYSENQYGHVSPVKIEFFKTTALDREQNWQITFAGSKEAYTEDKDNI
jgi:hypothetical protein